MARPAKQILPLFLSLLGLWLLVGCLYLPTPEHSVDWSKTDFRPFLDPGHSPRPIIRGETTRRTIVAILGRPDSASIERRELIYTYRTEWGVAIYPLCFVLDPREHGIYPLAKREYAVRFVFDSNDVVTDWELAEEHGYHHDVIGPRLGIRSATQSFESVRPRRTNSESRPASQRPEEE